jgi:hypothetical protein
MKNEVLKDILESYKTKSNKELSNIAVGLHTDFTALKNHMLELTQTIEEISEVYEKIMIELQSRLHFEMPKTPDNASGD